MKQKLIDFFLRVRFSTVFLGERSDSFIKSKRFKFVTVISSLLIYTMLIVVLTLISILYTPLNRLFITENIRLSSGEVETMTKLNDRVNSLLREVESLKELNQNLRNAILLGDSTLLKNFSLPKKENQVEGNITKIFSKYFLGENKNDSLNITHELLSIKKPIKKAFVSRGFIPEIGHFGVDFSAKVGTPISAVANGYVVFADFTIDDGFMIIISHPDQFISVYKHCLVLFKSVRDIVVQGEIIASTGNTGKLTTGPHLHFELWQNGKAIDPTTYFWNF